MRSAPGTPFSGVGILWLPLLIALAARPAAAQNTPNFWNHPDYTVQQWTIHNGLPSNTIKDILQTSDGYLWIATIEGVLRFDGHRFTLFNATNTPGLASNRILSLAEGPPGHLWITAEPEGLTHYHDGIFHGGVVHVPGAPAEATTPIALNEGLNWVGYLPEQTLDVYTAPPKSP